MPTMPTRKISISLQDETWKFVSADAEAQNHFNKSRVIAEALALLKIRRNRQAKNWAAK